MRGAGYSHFARIFQFREEKQNNEGRWENVCPVFCEHFSQDWGHWVRVFERACAMLGKDEDAM
jgi:hypothetical protein